MSEERLINEILFLDETKLFTPIFVEEEHHIHLAPTKYYKKIENMLDKVGYYMDAESLLKVNKRVYEYTQKLYSEQSQLHRLPLTNRKFENINHIINIVSRQNEDDILMEYADTFTDENILLLASKYKSSGEDLAKLAIKCDNKIMKYELVSRIIDEELPKYCLYDILIAEYKNSSIADKIIRVISNRGLINAGKEISDESSIVTNKIKKELIKRFKSDEVSIEELERFHLEVLHISYSKFINELVKKFDINPIELEKYVRDNYQRLTEVDLKVIEEKLLDHPQTLVLYAKNITKANLYKIENVLVEKGELEALIDFASDIKFVDMNRLERLVYESKDINLIAKLEIVKAKRNDYKINNKNIIEEILNDINDPKIVYMLSKYCAKEYLKQCEHHLRRLNSDEYLRYYYKDRRKK